MVAKKGTTTAAVKGNVIGQTFTIEDNIAIPAVAKGNAKYPFEALQPGQSFLKLCPIGDMKKVKLGLAGAARRVSKKTGAQFLVLERPEEKGVRVWRTDKPTVVLPTAPMAAPVAQGAPDLSAFIPSGKK